MGFGDRGWLRRWGVAMLAVFCMVMAGTCMVVAAMGSVMGLLKGPIKGAGNRIGDGAGA